MTTRREFFLQAAALATPVAPAIKAAQNNLQPTAHGHGTPMKTCKIPQTDLTVSRISYGTGALSSADAWDSADFMEKLDYAIHTAYDNGINFFDLAVSYGYGRSESALGKVLKNSPGLREKIVVQSK